MQRICERTTNEVIQGETTYSITFLSCTSDLNKAEKQNILKRHKSSLQKTRITTKRRNSYAQLGTLKRKKCLDSFQQYYKDNRLHILNVSAQKYKSMDVDKKHNLLAKCKEKYKSKDADEKHNLLAKCRDKYKSKDADEKHNLLAKCRDKYKSKDADEKHDLLAKCKEKYQSMDEDQKHNLLAKCKVKYQSMDEDQKHNLLGACKEKYISMDAAKKQILLTACADKYKAMDEIKKQNLLTVYGEKYKAMNPNKKQQMLSQKRQAYDNMDSTKKEKKILKQRKTGSDARYKKTCTGHNLDSCIKTFHKKVREGPYYICSVCNRILYGKTVQEVKKNMYGFQHLFTGKKSFDDKEYICKTCKSKLVKGQVPCQAVSNKLGVDDVPPEIMSRET